MAERKNRLTAPEMALERKHCRELLFAEWRDSGAGTGTPLPGVRVIAEKFDLPLSVVRAALDELKNEGVIESAPRTGMKLAMMPEPPRTLAGCRFAIICKMDLSHPRIQYQQNTYLLTALERRLNQRGASLELLNTWTPQGISHEKCLKRLREGNFDGLVVGTEGYTPELEKIAATGFPVVVNERRIPHADIVEFDHADVGATMARHLLACGVRRLAICAFPEFYWSEERAEAVCRVYRDAGMPEPLRCDLPFVVDTRDLNDWLVRHADGLDGVFAVNDDLAVTVLNQLHQLEIPVPEAIQVAGVDDLPAMRYWNLTTVQLYPPALGSAMAERLARRVLTPTQSRPDHLQLKCPLIVRGTTKIMSIEPQIKEK